ncbi:MAG: hypothetical protein IPL67_19900 [Ignavibacteria bacterium]|nr:hypothetical protein [Ignavibacteria bacterium]
MQTDIHGVLQKRLNDFDFAVVTTLYICFEYWIWKQNSVTSLSISSNGNLLDKGLTKIAHEGGRAHGLLNVTPSDFFSLELRIPGFIEQEAIAKVINKADKDLRIVKTKLQLLKKQKRGLMEVLLAGRRRLNNGER